MNNTDIDVDDSVKGTGNPPTKQSLHVEPDIQEQNEHSSKNHHIYTKLICDSNPQSCLSQDGVVAMSTTDDTSSTVSLGSSSPSQESTWSLGSNSPIHASSIAAAIYPARQLCMNILSEFSRNVQSGKRKRTLSDSELDKNAKQEDNKAKDKQRRPGSPTLVSKKSEQILRKKAKYPWQIKGTSGSARHRKLYQRKIAFQNILASSQGAIFDQGPCQSRKRCYSDSENGKMKDAKNKKRKESVEYLDIDSKQGNKTVTFQRAGPSNVDPASGPMDNSGSQISNRLYDQNNRAGFTAINPRDHPHLYEQSTIGGLKLLAQLSSNKSLMPQGAIRFPELRPPRLSNINSGSEKKSEGISNTQSDSDQQQISINTPLTEPNSSSAGNSEEASLPSTNSQNDNNATDASFLQKWQNQHLAKAVVDNAINKTLEELGLSPSPGNSNTTAYRRQRRNVENAGVSALIRTRGLRRHSADRMRRMQPIVHRLTQVSENIFAQNMFGPRSVNSNNSQNNSEQAHNRPPTLRRSASATEVIPNVGGSGNVDNTDSASSTYSVSSTPAREFDNSFDIQDCNIDSQTLQSVHTTMNSSRHEQEESDTEFIDSNSEDEEHNTDLSEVNLEEVSCEDVIPEDVSVPHYEENPRHDILDQAINAAICERGLLLD